MTDETAAQAAPDDPASGIVDNGDGTVTIDQGAPAPMPPPPVGTGQAPAPLVVPDSRGPQFMTDYLAANKANWADERAALNAKLAAPVAAPAPAPAPPVKDPFTAAVDGALDGQAQAMQAAVMQASDVPADQYKTAYDIAHQTGVPVDVVQRNLPVLQDQVNKASAASIDYRGIAASNPVLADFYIQPGNAGLAHDDVGMLDTITKTLAAAPGAFGSAAAAVMDPAGTAVRVANGYPVGDIATAYQSGQSDIDSALAAERILRGVGTTDDTDIISTADNLKDISSLRPQGTGTAASNAFLWGVSNLPFIVDNTAVNVASGLGGAAGGFALGGGPPGAAAGYKVASGIGGFEFNRRVMTGQTFLSLSKVRDTDGKPLDPDVIKGMSYVVGASNAVLMAIPMHQLTASMGKAAGPALEKIMPFLTENGVQQTLKMPGMADAFKQIGLSVAKGSLTFGSITAAQTALSDLGQRLAQNLSGGTYDNPSAGEEAGRIGESFKGGAELGLMFHAPYAGLQLHGAFQAQIARENNQPSPASVSNYIAVARATIPTSKLFARDPAKFSELADKSMGGADAFIPVDKLQTFFQSLDPEKAQGLDLAMPDLRTRVDTAADTGEDVRVNRADFFTHIQPLDEQKTLDDYVRLAPDHMTTGELADYDRHMAEILDIKDTAGQTDSEETRRNAYNQLLQNFMGKIAPSANVDTATTLSEFIGRAHDTFQQRYGDVAPQAGEIVNRLIKGLAIQRYMPGLNDLVDKPDQTDLLINQARKRVRAQAAAAATASTPILDYLANVAGKVKTGSRAARDLADLNVTPSTHGRVFSEDGTVTGLDKIAPSELQREVGDLYAVKGAQEGGSGDTESNAIDPQWLHDNIDMEARDKGPQTEDMQNKSAHTQYLDDLVHAIDHLAGLDITTASNPEIKRALEQLRREQEAPLQHGMTLEQKIGKAPLEVYENDHGEHENEKSAIFSDKGDGSHVTYVLDAKNNIRIQGIFADADGKIRGRQIVQWLNDHYGRPIIADEVAHGAEDFWNKMQDEGLINEWNREQFTGKTKKITEPKTLRQGQPVDPQGAMSYMPDGKAIMTLFQKEDLSTVLHELGHLYHRVLSEIARSPGGEAAAKDLAVLHQFAGAEAGAKWEDLTRAQHETIADGFLSYLRKGEAPSADLAGMFSRFAAWLTRLYRGARDTLPDIKPEVAAVFDRMLATDDEINRMKNGPEFTGNEAIRNMLSAADKERYDKQVAGIVAEARADLLKKAMRQAERQGTAEYKEKYAATSNEAAEQVQQERGYQAIDGVRAHGGLDRTALRKLFGPEIYKYMNRHGLLAEGKGGADPADIAPLFGYKNGRDMVQEFMGLPKRADRIKQLTDAMMQERYGDMLHDGSIEREAVNSFHNAVREKMLELEQDTLAKAAGVVAPTKEAIKAKAIQNVLGRPISEILPYRNYRAEVKAAAASGKALGKKDFQTAAVEKSRQLYNHYLYKMGSDGREQVQADLKNFRRLLGRSDKDIAKSMDIDFAYAARAILGKYGIGKPPAHDYAAWITAMATENPELADTLGFAIAQYTAAAKPWRDSTLAEFQDMSNAVKNLIESGRGANTVKKDGEKVEKEKALEELASVMEAKQGHGLPPDYEGWRLKAMGYQAVKQRIEAMALWMDGKVSGPFHDYVWNPLNDAQTKMDAVKWQWAKRMHDILEPHKDDLHGEPITANEMIPDGGVHQGVPFQFTDKGQLIGFLLHLGNEGNKYKLLNGYHLDEEGLQAFLDRAERDGTIKAKDWDLVQSMWDLVAELKPEAQRVHKEVFGFRFPEVASDEVQTAHGAYKGGYWPAVIDFAKAEADGKVQANTLDRAMMEKVGDSYMFPSVWKGFTKGRVDAFAAPLQLDLDMLPAHVNKVLRFIHMTPAVHDVAKIVRSKDFMAMMNRIDPALYKEALVPMLQRASRQVTDMADMNGFFGDVERGLNTFRSRTYMALVMGNFKNMMMQYTNFPSLIKMVGWDHAGEALFNAIANGRDVEDTMREKSDFMKTRQLGTEENYQRLVKRIMDPSSTWDKITDFSDDHAMLLQHTAWKLMDKVGWMGAYNRAITGDERGIEKGDERGAVRFADETVRHYQGSNRPIDLSTIESKNAFWRILTMMQSFYNSQGNYYRATQKNIKEDYQTPATLKAARLMYLHFGMITIPSLIAETIVGAIRGTGLPGQDDKDKDPIVWQWLKFIGMADMRAAMAMKPIVGGIVNQIMEHGGGKIAGYLEKSVGMQPHPGANYNDHLSLSPTFTMADEMLGLPGEVVDNMQGKGDVGRTAMHLMDAGTMAGLPLGWVKAPVGYGIDVARGKMKPQGPGDVLRGLVAGPVGSEKKGR